MFDGLMQQNIHPICLSVISANDHGGKIPPWEEDNGIYGIMVSKGTNQVKMLLLVYIHI